MGIKITASFETVKFKIGRLLKKMQNFVFYEWELYIGTAPEQKTENAKKN